MESHIDLRKTQILCGGDQECSEAELITGEELPLD